ncbi:MAG: anti-sigma factor antagonist [Candidatus Omnitrophota bacterium]
MEIRVRQQQSVIVLDISGAIDVNAATLIEVVGQCLRDGYTEILCNFEETESVDYMGVSVIVIAYKEVMNHQGRMRFSCVPAHLRNIFSISGLDRVIELYPTEELALSSFKEDKVIENIRKLKLRRRFKRLPIDIKVELRDRYDKTATCLKLDILDLSALGAYIYGCSNFRLGDAVTLKFKLPPKPEELELEGKVVWLSDKQVQSRIHPGMGVEFCNISKANQERIFEFVERNLSFMSSEEDESR